jgi:hypothetical protein
MKRIILLVTMLALFALAVTACAETPTPTPVPAPTKAPQPTAVPPTAVPPTAVPPTAVPPTATKAPTAVPPTLAPTAIPPTVAPTAVPPTTAPTAIPPTATAVPPTAVPPTKIPSGLYVTNLALNPADPVFNKDISFTATFVNATDSVKTFKWVVYIFRADAPIKSNYEMPAQTTNFPVGSNNYPSIPPAFKLGVTGYQCEYFFARVGWLDADSKITYFTNTDGKVYEKGFKVCDQAIVPTLVPPTAGPTAIPPTPQPGLFVTDLRIQPAPVRGFDLTFFPTFINTKGDVMTFKWRVFIYKADNLNTSYSETSYLTTGFPANPGEVKSDGTWKLTLGGPCENFIARVGWLDSENKIQFFMKPDGKTFEKPFAVCPP